MNHYTSHLCYPNLYALQTSITVNVGYIGYSVQGLNLSSAGNGK